MLFRSTEIQRNVNLSYNPATGVNYPFTDLTRRPFPEWGLVSVVRPSTDGYQNDRGLQTAITKRFSNKWEMQGTYTLAWLKDATPKPVAGSIDPKTGVVVYQKLPFETAPDMGGEYTYSVADQRHRATVNGVWQLPHAFQLSGLYFFGSGMRYGTAFSADVRTQGANGENRFDRTTGTIAPRNGFVGKPLHRVDMRLLRGFKFANHATFDGILEVFNLFKIGRAHV